MSFRASQVNRLRQLGGIHCWGFGSGGLDGADAAGQFGGSSGVGTRGGDGGDRSGYTPSSSADRRGRTSRDGVSSGNSGIGREGYAQGESTRATVNAAISLASLANPLAGLLGWLGVEAYAAVKGLTATTANQKSYAKGLEEGPQKTALESVLNSGLSLAPVLGVSSTLAGVSKSALAMATAARVSSSKAGTLSTSERGGSLGAWTDKESVRAVLTRANVAATDDEVAVLAQDYNARHSVSVRKSRAINTKPERYAYLTSGWKP